MPQQPLLDQGPLVRMKNEVLALSTCQLEELAEYIETVLAMRRGDGSRQVVASDMHDLISRSFEAGSDFRGTPPQILMSEDLPPGDRSD